MDKDGVAIKSDLEIALLTKGLIRVQKIYFNIGKANIKPESNGILNEIGRILEKYPDLKIEIGGHTDATGSTEVNQRLSLERARSVKNFLISRFTELNEDNLSVSGYGPAKPIADNNTNEGRTLNRRVDFKVLNLEQIKK